MKFGCVILVIFFSHPLLGVLVQKPCDPALSRQATQAIQEQVFNWVSRDFSIRVNEEIPDGCDLLLWKDANYELNSMYESPIGRRPARCKRCSKLFKSSEYLDKHIKERHQPIAKFPLNCLGSFCSFLPCESLSSTLIYSLHEHHPARSRAAHTCREVFAKCFPPLKSPKFRKANEALLAHFCDGKRRKKESFSNNNTLAGFSLSTLVSYFIVMIIIGYYAFSMSMRYANRSSPTRILRKPSSTPPTTTPPPVQTPVKRKIVGIDSGVHNNV